MSTKPNFKSLLPKRKANSHKGDYGKIFILAGSRGLSGACALATSAALRAGAGLVTVGIPESLGLVMARRLTEAMWKPLPETESGTLDSSGYSQIKSFLNAQDVLAIGPGLSRNPSTQALIRRIILGSQKPMVIDADALNAFQGKASLLKKLKEEAILTPHPIEFTRVFGGKVPKTDRERIERAGRASGKYGVVLVLKGARTVVAAPDGRIFVNSTGNPGMATGGSGDVLFGIIAAFLGQGLRPFEAAKAAVYLHGLAGDLAARKVGEISVVANDLIENLPKAFRKVLGR